MDVKSAIFIARLFVMIEGRKLLMFHFRGGTQDVDE